MNIRFNNNRQTKKTEVRNSLFTNIIDSKQIAHETDISAVIAKGYL